MTFSFCHGCPDSKRNGGVELSSLAEVKERVGERNFALGQRNPDAFLNEGGAGDCYAFAAAAPRLLVPEAIGLLELFPAGHSHASIAHITDNGGQLLVADFGPAEQDEWLTNTVAGRIRTTPFTIGDQLLSTIHNPSCPTFIDAWVNPHSRYDERVVNNTAQTYTFAPTNALLITRGVETFFSRMEEIRNTGTLERDAIRLAREGMETAAQ